ncbi:MAG: hypothetical protein J5997_13700 [Oscillospiraceae bacterium]|nr:hypothetical protein [Oscillospiraceae bacterium]
MLKFRYEILYRRIGDELTIYTAEVEAKNSIDAEEKFMDCPYFMGCELLDTNMIGVCR